MEPQRFDNLVHSLATSGSRRALLLSLLGLTATGSGAADARHKKHKKRCKHGLTRCGKVCVDLQTNARFCGDCAIRCNTCSTCAGGQCVPATDGTSCGACGACQQGHCVTTCAPTEQCASGACVAACDPPCSPSQACVNTTCVDVSGGCQAPDDFCQGRQASCPDQPSGTTCVLVGGQPFCESSLTCTNDGSDLCQTDDDCRTGEEVGPNARCVAHCAGCQGGSGCLQFYRDPNG